MQVPPIGAISDRIEAIYKSNEFSSFGGIWFWGTNLGDKLGWVGFVNENAHLIGDPINVEVAAVIYKMYKSNPRNYLEYIEQYGKIQALYDPNNYSWEWLRMGMSNLFNYTDKPMGIIEEYEIQFKARELAYSVFAAGLLPNKTKEIFERSAETQIQFIANLLQACREFLINKGHQVDNNPYLSSFLSPRVNLNYDAVRRIFRSLSLTLNALAKVDRETYTELQELRTTKSYIIR